MTDDLARRVRRRARHRCEYCRLPQSAVRFRNQVDHIVAEQHEGGDGPSNLAWPAPIGFRSLGAAIPNAQVGRQVVIQMGRTVQ
jgi:hypothetical protein